MLQKYIERLLDALHNLRTIENGSFLDYIQTVELEFGVAGILLVHLMLIVFIIGTPIILIPKLVRKVCRNLVPQIEYVSGLWNGYHKLCTALPEIIKNCDTKEDINNLNTMVNTMNEIRSYVGYSKLIGIKFDSNNIASYKVNYCNLPGCWRDDDDVNVLNRIVDRLNWLRFRKLLLSSVVVFACGIVHLMFVVPLIFMLV